MEWTKSSMCRADEPMCIEIAELNEQELAMRGAQFGPVIASRGELKAFVTSIT